MSLPNSQVAFLHSCQSMANSRTMLEVRVFIAGMLVFVLNHCMQMRVQVVTTEWLAYCLRLGKRVVCTLCDSLL